MSSAELFQNKRSKPQDSDLLRADVFTEARTQNNRDSRVDLQDFPGQIYSRLNRPGAVGD